MSQKKYDVFISHASEDKDAIARSLAEELTNYGVEVWYDEFTLEVGDSLTKKINEGLANARYGIVILSKNFLNKGWPEYELEGLTNREIGSQKVILPIWHGITKTELLSYSPTLAGKVAIDTSKVSIRELILKLLKVIRPDIFDSIIRRMAYRNLIKNAKTQVAELSKLRPGPIRHENLPPTLINRIQLVHSVFADIYDISLERTINNFQRDINPEQEVSIWERMAIGYLSFNRKRQLTSEEKKEVFSIVLNLSFGKGLDNNYKTAKLTTEDIAQIIQGYSNLPNVPENKPEWDE